MINQFWLLSTHNLGCASRANQSIKNALEDISTKTLKYWIRTVLITKYNDVQDLQKKKNKMHPVNICLEHTFLTALWKAAW